MKLNFLLAFIVSIFSIVHTAEGTASHDWDILIFTQQWPVTVCDEWKKHNPSNKCNMPTIKDSWSVHGVWPTKLGTRGPGFCNNSWHFDPELIRPIETDLMQLWPPNIEAGNSVYFLWNHEWSKHGTCAAAIEPLNSELKYFNQGLNWVQKYKIYDMLQEAGIVPSDVTKYNLNDIYRAIFNKIGVKPRIECRQENGDNYLVEVYICFTKSLGLVNCDGVKRDWYYRGDILTNCDVGKGILYPKTPASTYNSLFVEFYKLIQWVQWLTL